MRVEIPFVLQDDQGNALDGTARVYLRGTTTNADVFASDTGGSPLTQPLTVSQGKIQGWVEEGSYNIVGISGSLSFSQPWDAVGYRSSFPITGTAGGDLRSTYPNPLVKSLSGDTLGKVALANATLLEWGNDTASGFAATIGTDAALKFWARMSDTTDLTLADSGPFALTMTKGDIGGAVSLGQPALLAGESVNKSIHFQLNSMSYGYVGNAFDLSGVKPFTFGFFWKPTAGNLGNNHIAQLKQNGTQVAGLRTAGTTMWAATRAGELNVGGAVVDTLYFVVITFDGATTKVYVNGTLINSVANATSMGAGNIEVNVGQYYTGNWSAGGYMDELFVLGRGLTAAEVTSLNTTATSAQPVAANLKRFSLSKLGTDGDWQARDINATGTVGLPTYTTATRPSAASVGNGRMIYVSDGAAGSNVQVTIAGAWVGIG